MWINGLLLAMWLLSFVAGPSQHAMLYREFGTKAQSHTEMATKAQSHQQCGTQRISALTFVAAGHLGLLIVNCRKRGNSMLKVVFCTDVCGVENFQTYKIQRPEWHENASEENVSMFELKGG